jgi:DNA mismatch repair ATPase MutS
MFLSYVLVSVLIQMLILSSFYRCTSFTLRECVLRSRRHFSSRILMSGLPGSQYTGDMTLDHLTGPDTKINGYWIEQLKRVERPIAKSLISQLIADNPLGYDPNQGPTVSKMTTNRKAGSVLTLAIAEKRKHPTKIILLRVGDFYECFGIDAIMLTAYAGLNPMANKCRAGCPIKNVQQTLDDLTEVGFSVAVYEEMSEIDPKNRKAGKERGLSQIVSPASRTYIYDLCLRPEDIEFKENRPAVGILKTPANGYLLCEIYLDEKNMIISERLTEEAIHSMISNTGAIDPIYLQDISLTKDLPFLNNNHHQIVSLHGFNEENFPRQVLNKIGSLLELPDIHSFRIINQNDLSSYSSSTSTSSSVHTTTTTSSGVPSTPSSTTPRKTLLRPRPVYTSTALQIGLLPNDNVPDLIRHLLPQSGGGQGMGMAGVNTAISSRFLRKWLINPPPYQMAQQMQFLCQGLLSLQQSIPSFQSISIGKIIALLTAKQCNVALFRDIHKNIHSLHLMLSSFHSKTGRNPYEEILAPLLEITTYESGIRATEGQLKEGCLRVLKEIDQIISLDDNHNHNNNGNNNGENDPCNQDIHDRIPEEFFKRNEESFRNKISLGNPEIQSLYKSINLKARELMEVIQREVPPGIDIHHDMMENGIMIAMKPGPSTTANTDPISNPINLETTTIPPIPNETDQPMTTTTQRKTTNSRRRSLATTKIIPAGIPGVEYIPYIDRKRKAMINRFTTRNIQRVLDEYTALVETAPSRITAILQDLSSRLLRDLITIVHTAHFAVILQAILLHAIAAKQKSWVLPELLDFPSGREEKQEKQGNDNDQGERREKDKEEEAGEQSQQPPPIQRQGDRVQMTIEGLRPYWLSQEKSIANNVEMDGILLLTAPNMSGKSTLMRSVIVIALLANCGLFVPSSFAQIPKFDHFFLRTASYDVPSEAKSAFALEMDDIRVILRDCTDRSLIMIDELGKGTSSRDGASLAGALLEHLNKRQVYGIFATHLHELFSLPLQLKNVKQKKMGFVEEEMEDDDNDDDNNSNNNINEKKEETTSEVKRKRLKWTYQLEDGSCEDSMALVTAANYHIPQPILRRAKQLMNVFDDLCRPQNQTKTERESSSIEEGEQSLSTSYNLQPEEEEQQQQQEDLTSMKRREVDSRPQYLQNIILPVVEQFSEEFQSKNNNNTSSASEESGSLFLSDPLFIPMGHTPPPFIENQSVLYILHIYSSKQSPVTSLSLSSSVPYSIVDLFFFRFVSFCF